MALRSFLGRSLWTPPIAGCFLLGISRSYRAVSLTLFSLLAVFFCSWVSVGEERPQRGEINIPERARRLQYPGGSNHELVDALTYLRQGYLRANSPFENVRVTGRISQVTAKWKPGTRDLTEGTMPVREWKKFNLTIKDGKKRFERGYTQTIGEGSSDMTVYRLFDGDSHYKLDGTALVIVQPPGPEEQWIKNDAFAFYQCELVRFTTFWCKLPDYLDNLVELINKNQDSRDERGGDVGRSIWKLACWRENDHIVLQFDQNPSAAARQTIWITPKQGFRMVKELVESGRRDDGLYIREERDVTHMRLAPETFFPQRATMFATTLGKGPERDGGAG